MECVLGTSRYKLADMLPVQPDDFGSQVLKSKHLTLR